MRKPRTVKVTDRRTEDGADNTITSPGFPLFPSESPRFRYIKKGLKPSHVIVFKLDESGQAIPCEWYEGDPNGATRESLERMWGQGTYKVELISEASNTHEPEVIFSNPSVKITKGPRDLPFPGERRSVEELAEEEGDESEHGDDDEDDEDDRPRHRRRGDFIEELPRLVKAIASAAPIIEVFTSRNNKSIELQIARENRLAEEAKAEREAARAREERLSGEHNALMLRMMEKTEDNANKMASIRNSGPDPALQRQLDEQRHLIEKLMDQIKEKGGGDLAAAERGLAFINKLQDKYGAGGDDNWFGLAKAVLPSLIGKIAGGGSVSMNDIPPELLTMAKNAGLLGGG